jgi:RNA polymerase sigma-70 factor (ECF subfamily)
MESFDPVIQTRMQHRMARVEHELSGLSDHALVLAVGRYDEAAMGELYRRHGRSVFGLATRLLTDRTTAEEILQDVFVRLWRQPERFDANRGELRAFLLRETHSRSVDRMRSDSARSRREDRHQREDASPTVDVDREVWHLIRSERIKDALDELSAGERDAIMLAYFEGHTYREVAVMLNEPEGTIKSRIRLGLKKLADKLEAAGLGAPS